MMNLMAGANPMWLSKMIGHTTMKMLLTTYSKWIDGADKIQERLKICLMNTAAKMPQKKDKVA